jgi:hypothetical protein
MRTYIAVPAFLALTTPIVVGPPLGFVNPFVVLVYLVPFIVMDRLVPHVISSTKSSQTFFPMAVLMFQPVPDPLQ